jgi:hypothetical protein
VFYMVFLAVLATEPSAQTDGDDTGGEVSANQNDQSDGDCPGAEEVEAVTGNGDKQSPVFDISGNSFRITVDSMATSQDPQVAGVTVFVRPEGNNDEIVADFAVEEGKDDSSIINAGPGRFFLEVLAANAEYTITVEDCVGANQDNGNQNNDQNSSTPEMSTSAQNPSNQKAQPRRNDVTRSTIPRRRLPPTGGLSTHVMVTGSIFVGTCLLGLGLVVRRGSRD